MLTLRGGHTTKTKNEKPSSYSVTSEDVLNGMPAEHFRHYWKLTGVQDLLYCSFTAEAPMGDVTVARRARRRPYSLDTTDLLYSSPIYMYLEEQIKRLMKTKGNL